MKSRTKPALRVVAAAQVQLSLSMDGVLRDVQHAFYGLCVNAGKQVLGHRPAKPANFKPQSDIAG